MDDLLRALAALAADSPPESLQRLAVAFEDMSGGGPEMPPSGAVRTPRQLGEVRTLVRAWERHPDVPARAIALALRSTHAAVRQTAAASSLELVWTGPIAGPRTVRRTDEGLYELLRGARQSLTIITFAAYQVPELDQALRAATERDVQIRLILEFAGESQGKVSYDPLQAIGKAVPDAAVFYWPLDQRERDPKDRHGTLHAKCAVADREIVLLSSANLTGDALERNMELGVLLRDAALAEKIEDHFDRLIEAGILERFYGD